MRKQILSILLVLVMILALVPAASAEAPEEGQSLTVETGVRYGDDFTGEVGEIATVSVTLSASVSFTVYSYQWQYRSSSTAEWHNCAGTGYNTSRYSFEIKAYHDGYQYRCYFTTSIGNGYSDVTTIHVIYQPSITTQPASKTVKAGNTAKFTVAAKGNELSYQWYYRTSSSGEWKASTASSAKSATLSVTAETYRSGYQYRCKVSNSVGYTYSKAATLTVVKAPSVTTQPSSVKTASGNTAKFTVKASGGSLSYQWQYRTSSSGSWQNSTASSAKTATLSVTAETYRSGYQYRCKISNAAGTVYSNAATLTVTNSSAPSITTQPKSSTIGAGGYAAFVVKASGSNLKYQWYYRTSSSGEWKTCSDSSATTATLLVEAKAYRNGYQYRCKVSNSYGSVTSNTVTLKVS